MRALRECSTSSMMSRSTRVTCPTSQAWPTLLGARAGCAIPCASFTRSWGSLLTRSSLSKVHQRPSRIGSTFKGGMTGTFDWRFEPQAEQTRVTVDVNYKLAGGAVGKAVDAMLLERTNQKTIQQMLQNLSRLATEAKAPGPA